MVDPRGVHVDGRCVPVEQARWEMFDDRVGEEHMRLNVSFNASALIRIQPGCSTRPQFNSFV